MGGVDRRRISENKHLEISLAYSCIERYRLNISQGGLIAMIYVSVLFIFLLVLTLLLTLTVHLGYRYGLYRLTKHADHKLEVVSVAETSVLGLLGLLIAFTFSGAYDRFETRKIHLIEEAATFATAYDNVDLVATTYQAKLRESIRHYVELQLRAYQDIPHFAQVKTDRDEILRLQHDIWETVAKSAQANPNNGLAQIYIPNISKMFDVAQTGLDLTLVHPPAIIFELLIGLALLGGFLVGYTAAENKQNNSLHVISYVLITAFTIFVILNLEFPRVGFIRYNSFDYILVAAMDNMK